MQVDPAPVPTPSRRILLSPESPFDLDHLVASWDQLGRSKIPRLLHLANLSPSLAGPALTLALASIKHLTLDLQLYEHTFHHYRRFIQAVESGEEADPMAVQWLAGLREQGGAGEEKADRDWVDKARKDAQSGQERLEVELKGYSTNMIKESIRMGHRDLARHEYLTGDLQAAVRSYTKSREFCSTSQHVLEMCLGVIEVALDLQNYAFVRNYISKALSALDSTSTSASAAAKSKAAGAVNLPGMVAPAQDPVEAAKEKERKIVLERLTVANGVAYLGQGMYEKAAGCFTDVGGEALVAGEAHFIPPTSVALFSVLLSLACYSRSQLRTRVLDNPNLRGFLDTEPWLRDIVRCFYENRFREGLEGLMKYEARFLLDLHLTPHYSTLLSLLSSRSLLTFLTPYSSLSLSRYASAFGWPEPYLLASVTDLIKRGEMKARIDTVGRRVVQRKRGEQEERRKAFEGALRVGEEGVRKVRGAELRLKLLAADVVIKHSKSSSSAGGGGKGGGKQVVVNAATSEADGEVITVD
ncbi:hypothetical protein JCM8547_003712 [Rhodosporidiobolus lusitaniae]